MPAEQPRKQPGPGDRLRISPGEAPVRIPENKPFVPSRPKLGDRVIMTRESGELNPYAGDTALRPEAPGIKGRTLIAERIANKLANAAALETSVDRRGLNVQAMKMQVENAEAQALADRMEASMLQAGLHRFDEDRRPSPEFMTAIGKLAEQEAKLLSEAVEFHKKNPGPVNAEIVNKQRARLAALQDLLRELGELGPA